MSREIKFRMVYQTTGEIIGYTDVYRLLRNGGDELPDYEKAILQGVAFEQYTGLKDKTGKEIYENCELDGRYRVEYIAPKFVGKDMVKGDIIELYDNKFTITKEHCEISQNSERGTN